MTEEKKQSLHSTSILLCEAYNNLYENREVAFPLHDEHIDKIDSLVKTIEGTWFGVSNYPTHKDKAAAFFCFIIKDHPVTDGNKRLSVLWLSVYCKALNIAINLPENITLDEIAVSIEKEKEMSMKSLTNLVRIILF
jgi:death on curing protein